MTPPRSILRGLVIAVLAVSTLTSTAVPASDFIGSNAEYATWGGIAVSTLLLEWKPINENHPLLEGEQKSYIEKERVPDWGLALAHMSALSATRFIGDDDDQVRYSHGYVMAAGINALATALTKAVVGRKRPNYEDALAQGTKIHSKSFYSGHASNTFMMATYLTLWTHRVSGSTAWKLAVPAALYGGATYTAWSRVAEHRHYTSDVIVGAAAGTVVGATVFSWYDHMGNTDESTARIAPWPGGVMLVLTF